MKQNLLLAFLSLCINNYIVCYEFNNIEERLEEFNYLYKKYTVTTEDGYILNNFRIFARNCKNAAPDVVLLGHGSGSSSASFLNQDPEFGLGFLLADQCHDVYLVNFRGSFYSLGHKIYKTADSRYWNWSFNEMGIYDLPASIELARITSNVDKVSYIGHSSGASLVLVLLSVIPSYNNVIENCFLIAPVVYSCNTQNAVNRIVGPLEKNTRLITLVLSGDFNLNGLLTAVGDLLGGLGLNGIMSKIQYAVDSLINGNDKCKGLVVGNLLFHTQSRISAQDFVHFTQLAAECNFKPYQPYSAATPESYPLENVTTRIFAYAGQNDQLVAPKDIDLLMNAMPLLKVKYIDTDHSGLLACSSSKSTVFDSIIEIIKESTVIDN